MGDLFMMMIVRLYPKDDKEKLWQCVLPILQNVKSEHYRPLFISQWEPVDFTTVMFDVNNAECIYKLFTKELSQCDMIEQSRTLTLMSPIFYPVPKNRPGTLHRYRIAVRVDTAHLESAFNKITNIDYSKLGVLPTYQAFSFGEDDILLSVLSEKEENINNFIQKNLAQLEGVNNVEYLTITRSLRIIPKDEWQAYRKKLYKVQTEEEVDEMDEDFDWSLSNLAGLTGAFIDEL
jgi:translation elongation factor EF-1beta